MMRIVDEHVFTFLRAMGEEGSSYGTHMKDARLGFCNPNLLAKVVQMAMADGGNGFDGCIEVVQRTRGYRRGNG